MAAIEVVLRPRVCFECRTGFFLCFRCDRGQRYCSPACRRRARLRQRRSANRRNQQSPEGRLNHCDRQKAYRRRKAEEARQQSARNQGSAAVDGSTSSSPAAATETTRGPFPDTSPNALPSSWPETQPTPQHNAQRARQQNVTDQGSLLINCSASSSHAATPTTRRAFPDTSPSALSPRRPETQPTRWLRCCVCGRTGRFVDPFPHIPRHR